MFKKIKITTIVLIFALLFTAISIYYYLKDEFVTSSITLALAVGFKLWPILIFPILLRKLTNQKWKLVSSVFTFSVFVIVIFVPVLIPEKNSKFAQVLE